MFAYRFFLLGMCLSVTGCSNQTDISATDRCFSMGFTPFPYDYSITAIQEVNLKIPQIGDIVSHHLEQGVPWTEAMEGKPFHPKMMEDWNSRKAMAAGKKIFLSLNALNEGHNGMDGYRGEKDDMPLPEEFQNKPFNDSKVKQAYLNYCLRAVEHFQPDYLAIGIEINELFHNSPDQWPGYVELYKDTRTKIKEKYPNLPVFASVSLHNLTNPGWNDREKQQKEIQNLLADMDVLGISYYPFMAGQSERPVSTYDWLRQFSDKPIAISETGYPAEDIRLETFKITISGNPQKQKRYYEALLERANQDKYLFVISFLYRDYDALWEKIKASSPEAFVVWKDCGMINESGVERPALDLWKRYYALKKNE